MDRRLLCGIFVNRGREAPRYASRPRARTLRTVHPGDFFSLGGMLAPYVIDSGGSLAPWLLSAAALVALASWDPLATGGSFDIILLGLAAYELLIAITRPEKQECLADLGEKGRGGIDDGAAARRSHGVTNSRREPERLSANLAPPVNTAVIV
jgi:hypothetical protein